MKTTVIDKYILVCCTTDSIDYIVPGTRFYVVMSHQILYFLQNLFIPLLLFTNKERSSSKRRMDRGIADEASMPPFKFECFGSAA